MPHNITVFCSSSTKIAGVYADAARDLGRAIATAGWGLVYGGNYVGAMAALADGARSAGGRVIGITPNHFVDQGYGDHRCDELIICETMRQRKQILESKADALVALPGGLGTLEELIESIVGKTLGLHAKPIVLLDIQGFYRPLLAMIEEGIEDGFIRPRTRDLYFVAEKVGDAMEYLTANLT